MARRRLAALATAGLIAIGSFLVSPAQADENDDRRRAAESQQRAVDAAMGEIDELLEDTDAALVQAFVDLEATKAQIPAAEAELTAASAEVARLEAESAIMAQRLAAAESEERRIIGQIANDAARATELRAAVGRTAREAYRSGLGLGLRWVSAIGSAESGDDFIERATVARTATRLQSQSLRELEQVTAAARNQAARLSAVRIEVAELDTALDAQVLLAGEARSAAQQRRDELDLLVTDQRAKAATIEAQRAAQMARKAEYEAQQAALAAEIAAVIREQASRPQASLPATGPTTSGAILGPPVPSDPAVITSPYGWRVHPIYGYRKLHAGTDFRAYCGNPIIAAESGTVQWAKPMGGFGNQLMLNHGYRDGKSLLTSYNHLSRFAVQTGETVTKGQVIGYSGTTGTSTACHLHFEAYVDGRTVNPETLL
jgi:murein DD-endopeptidase MepM/ murein hydrolase activator NlpD